MSEPATVEGLDGYAATALSAVAGARRELLLQSWELDPRCYAGEAFVEAVKGFVLSSEQARLKVLLSRTDLARRGHALVALGRRVPSRIEFRELIAERKREHDGELLIADGRALLKRNDPRSLTALWLADAPAECKRAREDFLQLWEESVPAADLRELSL